jgi:hypothetical protein
MRCNLDIESKRLKKLHSDVLEILTPGGVWLAGGSLRTVIDPTHDVADYDLFFANARLAEGVVKQLEIMGWTVVWQCPKGELTTLKDEDDTKIQCITKRYYRTMSELIHSFDFTVCMAAYDGEVFEFDPRFIRHVKRKRLSINAVTFPVATINRIYKYRARDFVMYEQDVVDLVCQINEMTLSADNMALYVD